MGMQEKLQELRNGFETAYIDKTSTSNLAYKPQFISNDYKQGKKVLSSIEDELMTCDQFQISVAFITMGGITPLLQILQELESGKTGTAKGKVKQETQPEQTMLPDPQQSEHEELVRRLREIEVEKITPVQALVLLSELKARV